MTQSTVHSILRTEQKQKKKKKPQPHKSQDENEGGKNTRRKK